MCQIVVALQTRTKDLATAAIEFATATTKIEHEELRAASLLLVQEGANIFEKYGQRCATGLLTAFQKSAASSTAVASEALWILDRLAKQSNVSRAWILNAGGIEAMHAAIMVQHMDDNFGQSCAWLVYTLRGLAGLADLLGRSQNGRSVENVAVRVAVAWCVFDLVRTKRTVHGTQQQQAETAEMLKVLYDAWGHESMNPEGLWACVSALDAMIKGEGFLGKQFMDRGGAPLVLHTFRVAGQLGNAGQDLRRATAYLITSLAESSSTSCDGLKKAGALSVLAERGLEGSGADVEAVMWAIGTLGGSGAVLDVMCKQANSKPPVLRGGVLALSDCAFNATGDQKELSRLSVALPMLIELFTREEAAFANGASSTLLSECSMALGCVLTSLTPQVPPGVADVDRGVETLLRRLNATPTLNGSPGDTNTQRSFCANSAAERSAEALGRIALASPAWRGALRSLGVVEAITGWVRSDLVPQRLLKYLFWAAAAIAGLPFVANELRFRKADDKAAEAALCTIVDIITDDVEYDYALVGVQTCSTTDIPAIINLVLEVMQLHPGVPVIQGRCSVCIAHLIRVFKETQAALPGMDSNTAVESVAAAAVAPVVTAARRFARRPEVVKSTSQALRALFALVPFGKIQAATGGILAQALQTQCAVECVEEAWESNLTARGVDDLLEDAAAALILARGANAILPALLSSPVGSSPRSSGLKALVEVGRSSLQFLIQDAQAIANSCATIVSEESGTETGNRICELAALLVGFCGMRPSVDARCSH